jgi:DNA-binding CsgD family transcriptional regulator
VSSSLFEILKKQISLSHREIEVLKLLCDGKTNKAIAELLEITPAGVDFHRQSIYNKTDLSSVALLVKYAIKNGLVTVN